MDTGDSWWKEGVLYQIYPRSFADSNGDGIGDIPGIIGKLDYLESLGVKGIWLSPINTSPMYDFGYDVSDYRGIDPVFGTIKDFDRLIAEAHSRGIGVIMDLVMNHTSHLHPWFLESRSSRNNEKRDWYIWHPGKRGKAPNNWMASFGGSAWEWDAATESYSLHTFLPEHPDLNWRNPEMRNAMFAEISFWLDRGVDGFRLDVVNWFIKDDLFRDNPFTPSTRPRPYDLQKHIYDRNRPETHGIVREFRALLDRYPGTMSVGEVFDEKPGRHALSASYLGNGTDELHLAFDFSLIHERWNASRFLRMIEGQYGALPERGWPCFVFSNHDNRRSCSRIGGRGKKSARNRTLLTLLLTLRGTPFLYYGEEIGMSDGPVRRQEIVDPVGKRYWPFNRGRDPARTPMQWSGGPYAGFSSAVPWLPVNPEYPVLNVDRQEGDEKSLLSFTRKLIRLRREHPALARGAWEPLDTGKDGLLSYARIEGSERIVVLLNFTGKKRELPGQGDLIVLNSTHRADGSAVPDRTFSVYPNEASVFLLKG